MRITINAGHCPGKDGGVIGSTGLQEADVTFDIMSKTAEYLRAAGCEVLEVQENILQQITAASKQFYSDIFLSIHCNAADKADSSGTESFCDVLGGSHEKLATCIQQQIVQTMGTSDRGIKAGNYYVLRMAHCPAALVKIAFISNPDEESLLANETSRDQFAAAIARGITDYGSNL